MIDLTTAIKYIGGHWEDNGKKQFDFIVGQGLKPNHYFLDIGFGVFRGGRFFIDYLDFAHYCGIEQHGWLVEVGLNNVIKILNQKKEPIIVINSDFDFSKFILEGIEFDYVLAKSVFSHLTKDKIKQCLNNLKEVIKKDGVFYASIFVGDSSKNLSKSDDTRKFMYSLDEIKELADGWNVESMGNAGCYRQTMVKFTLKK